jgi:hypothetical protein
MKGHPTESPEKAALGKKVLRVAEATTISLNFVRASLALGSGRVVFSSAVLNDPSPEPGALGEERRCLPLTLCHAGLVRRWEGHSSVRRLPSVAAESVTDGNYLDLGVVIAHVNLLLDLHNFDIDVGEAEASAAAPGGRRKSVFQHFQLWPEALDLGTSLNLGTPRDQGTEESAKHDLPPSVRTHCSARKKRRGFPLTPCHA